MPGEPMVTVSALNPGSNGPNSGPALCSWARHFTRIVPFLTQMYKINSY